VEEWVKIEHNYLLLFKYRSLRALTLAGLAVMMSIHLTYFTIEDDLLLYNLNEFERAFCLYAAKTLGYLVACNLMH
jgi:hypothetical protein